MPFTLPGPIRRCLLVCVAMLTACTGLPALPATATTTPTPSPLPAPGVAPSLILATPSTLPVLLPSVTPAGQVFVRIKNAGLGSYLYDAGGQAGLADLPASDQRSQWVLEAYQGARRIRNRASGNYLSIEDLKPYVEVIPVQPVWMSPRWTIEEDPASGSVVVRNLWHTWQVLDGGTGNLTYAQVPVTEPAARWVLESADGEALVPATATLPAIMPTAAEPAGSRGATVPWVEYEAEHGQTNGQVLAPDRTFGTIAAESSGRSAVRLDKPGQYVQFRATRRANSVVVRYVIPDSTDGTGLQASISLYVNASFRQKIQLTSKYAWSYGGEQYAFNTPKAGGAHHFYDEARALVGDIPAGAEVKLQVDPDDGAAYYVIDLIDLEQVAPPKTQPAGSLSIVSDCQAVPDDGLDDGPAIQACIERARAKGVEVWIPAGTFESTTRELDVADVTIQGAGMWYTTIHGLFARFNCVGNNCRYDDFSILGETVLRDDNSPENGFEGGAGTGSRLENIWVEHTKVGYWVGPGTDGLVIINSRFRDLFADGVNFCNGTSNSLVENSHFRNTGDDALASWSPKGSGVNTNNVFRFDTVQLPWRANCFAIYGGKDNRVEDDVCADVVTYPGILVAQQFNSNAFSGSTIIQRDTLLRAGGPMFHDQHGALKIWADQGPINGLQVRDLLIDSPTFSGIELVGSYQISSAGFDHVQIRHPGTWGLSLHSDLAGDASFSFVTVSSPGKTGLLNYAPANLFKLVLDGGNSGW